MGRRKKQKVQAFVDADYLAYEAGFAGQHTHRLITSGDQLHGPFPTIPDMKEWLAKNHPKWTAEDYMVWERLEVEPVANVLHTVKLQLQGIETAVTKKFNANVDMHVYLTGKHNFRDLIATILPYKGNRDSNHRPVHYQAIREYMIEQWDAEVIDGREADDEVCIQQTRCAEEGLPSVICGIDKDLWQCPGWHYNSHKKGFANITERQGLKHFYKQLLMGDMTDNIRGCWKMGETGARRELAGIKDEASMLATVCVAYENSIRKYGEATGYAHMTSKEAVLENARLLWMMRTEDDVWDFPPYRPVAEELGSEQTEEDN